MTPSIRGWTRFFVAGAVALGIAACSEDASTPIDPTDSGGLRVSSAGSVEAELISLLDNTNAALATNGANYRIGKIEANAGTSQEMGITVLWKNVGNKQLVHDFVPNDPRRAAATGGWDADPNNITFAIDQGDGATLNGVPATTTTHEIRDAMATWTTVQCSNADINEVAAPVDLGVVAFLNGLGGSPFVVADLHHAGWLEIEFGGTTIAATFTFIFVDGAGNPTDIDANGRADTAFREIYYDAVCQACNPPNTIFRWEIDNGINDPGIDVDIESIALHEAGHGLSLAHFGKGFVTLNNNVLHQTSNSVMAAAYAGPRTDIQGTDKGATCSNWAGWPE